MKYCPKCEGRFYLDFEMQMCDVHQKEYDYWINLWYIPDIDCGCGNAEWKESTMQMTDPPTYPEALVYRCTKCDAVRCERADDKMDGIVRIIMRE